MRLALAGLRCLAATAAAAQRLAPGVAYDPAAPTLKAVIGHDPGDAIATP